MSLFIVLYRLKKDSKKDGKNFLKKQKPKIIRIPLQNGDCYYKVYLPERKGKIDYELLDESFKNVKGRCIFTFKSERNDLKFKSDILERIMLFNTASKYIKSKAEEGKPNTVTVIDRTADLKDRIRLFVPFCSYICVLTDNTRFYERTEEELMRDYGFSLVVKKYEKSFDPHTDYLFDFDGEKLAGFFGTAFSFKRKAFSGKQLLVPRSFFLPKSLSKNIPEGADSIEFISALFEKSKVKSIGELYFDCFNLD